MTLRIWLFWLISIIMLEIHSLTDSECYLVLSTKTRLLLNKNCIALIHSNDVILLHSFKCLTPDPQ